MKKESRIKKLIDRNHDFGLIDDIKHGKGNEMRTNEHNEIKRENMKDLQNKKHLQKRSKN